MNRLLLLSCMLTYCLTFGQEKRIPKKQIHKGFFVVDYVSVDMPTSDLGLDEPHMALTGVHYNLDLTHFYAGLGIYGAVRGRRGGFFTLGVDLGFRSYLNDTFFLDTGIHFGGGGGSGAPDGGGAFILPHLSLGKTFQHVSLTAGYSYINFFDAGNIKSHQAHIGLQIPLTIDYSAIDFAETTFSASELQHSEWGKNSRRMSFMLHLNHLSPHGNSQNSDGESLVGKTIRLAGFEMNAYLNNDWFLFAKFDGAYDGIRAGYMDILLGGGYHLGFHRNRTNILAKFGMGAGGGGGVETKGGILMYPDISIEQYLLSNVYLSINKGFLISPDTFFESSTFGIGLKYYTNMNGVADLPRNQKVHFKGFEVVVKHDVYAQADRMVDPAEELHQLSVQFNYYLGKHHYLAGQTSFANFGNAGAYAEGIVGLGIQTHKVWNGRVTFFVQGLIGGAGGGNISTGEGLIVKPSAGIQTQLSSGLSLRGALGYVKAINGGLRSPFANLGLSYRCSFLTSK